jgi:glycosyltransferase involved in cell wall biosynthesis
MKILFVIAALQQGGAERVASTLSNQWCADGHDVHVLTFEAPASAPHYPLADGITLHQLDLFRPSRNLLHSLLKNFDRVRRLAAAFRQVKPDIIVSFMTETNVLSLLASRFMKIPVVVSERTHPDRHLMYLDASVQRRFLLSRKLTYRFADAIVVQTSEIAEWFRKDLGSVPEVIPNPVDLAHFRRPTGRAPHLGEPRRKKMTALGRLDPQKGYDLLIDAFASLADRHPDWDLTIYGAGGNPEIFAQQAESRGLAGRVFLPGATRDVASKLQETDLFVHPTRYEGFPNAVVEALAAGCCVLATDCPGGTREILVDGDYGVLVPNEDSAALAEALDDLLGNSDRRDEFQQKARDAVSQLDMVLIARRWLKLFDSLRQ